MIAPVIAIAMAQVQGFAQQAEPDELQTLTILGAEAEGDGVEVMIDSQRNCGTDSKMVSARDAAEKANATWAYVILAPLHGDFMVWVDFMPDHRMGKRPLAADDFSAYVNDDSGMSDFSVDSFGNSDPY